MWSYYKDSAVCYAYLEDVSTRRSSAKSLAEDFRVCKWFTRAWTLQELIAPKTVICYDMHWTRIGSRDDEDLLSVIHRVTHIPEAILGTGGQMDLRRYSIAERMSW